MIDIDHIFIFSANKGQEADQLVKCGFTEGRCNKHPGQGTQNRKFYFENFFLEILWVHDEDEFRSGLIKPTGLNERADFQKNGFTPFGFCLENSEFTDPLFEGAYTYQPEYFPEGLFIEILNNKKHPGLPWTFRIPFSGKKVFKNESKIHHNEIRKLTSASFFYSGKANKKYLDFFQKQDNIKFIKSNDRKLVLEFDEKIKGKYLRFPDLLLQINY